MNTFLAPSKALALNTARLQAKLELESLIAQCHREIANLERFNDRRMLIATGDIAYHFAQVETIADQLSDAFDASITHENEEN